MLDHSLRVCWASFCSLCEIWQFPHPPVIPQTSQTSAAGSGEWGSCGAGPKLVQELSNQNLAWSAQCNPILCLAWHLIRSQCGQPFHHSYVSIQRTLIQQCSMLWQVVCIATGLPLPPPHPTPKEHPTVTFPGPPVHLLPVEGLRWADLRRGMEGPPLSDCVGRDAKVDLYSITDIQGAFRRS